MMVSMSGIRMALEYACMGDFEGVCDALRADGGVVGAEETIHPGGADEWVVIRDLSDYCGGDCEVLFETAQDIWWMIYWIGKAGVDATLVAGPCGVCDEFHLWLAAPGVHVHDLLDRVRYGNLTTVDVDALRNLRGVSVEVGGPVTIYRVSNGLGGFFRRYDVPVTVVVSGHGDYDGVYWFRDCVHDFPFLLGGDADEVRELVPIWRGW